MHKWEEAPRQWEAGYVYRYNDSTKSRWACVRADEQTITYVCLHPSVRGRYRTCELPWSGRSFQRRKMTKADKLFAVQIMTSKTPEDAV